MPRNLLRFKGTGILYSAPHNQTTQGFTRVENWQAIASWFSDKQEPLKGLHH